MRTQECVEWCSVLSRLHVMAYVYSDLILYILIPEAKFFLMKNSADPGAAKYRYYDKFRML
jgi:hypothetical protein